MKAGESDVMECLELGEGKVDFKKFVKTLMSERLLGKRKSTEESLKKVETFKGNKVPVNDLWVPLHTLDPDLTEEKFQQALKTVPVDENKNVDFDKFYKALEDTRQQAQETIEPSERILALSMITDDKVAKKDLDYVLKNMGIDLPKEQLEKLLTSTDDDSVNIKDFLSTLRSSDSFSNVVGKSFVKMIMGGYPAPDLKEIPKFADSIALQLASSGLENVQDDIIDYDELKNALNEQGLYAASEALTQMLPELAIEQGKIEPSEFMGVLSKVLSIPEPSGNSQ
ncbi:EF-hand calcium-binding domain-containing protein 13-like [Sarcophilus harrisii]|uniref:EF-hand calcium-binding domain-containing protein 13-like n=1 Tax=Sarcophilus harrisii TaxID=9305 RepID=UPI0013020BB4|nr:EF-hand calcium-binding domain-containing protein 13-like [Sarcophilus harrisii]